MKADVADVCRGVCVYARACMHAHEHVYVIFFGVDPSGDDIPPGEGPRQSAENPVKKCQKIKTADPSLHYLQCSSSQSRLSCF